MSALQVHKDFVAFEVVGHAEPAGSKTAYVVKGHAVVTDANKKAKPWQNVVASAARGAMLKERKKPYEGPVWVQMVFYKERPVSHFKVDGELSAEGNRRQFPDSKPDLLKLARAVEDALTGIVYKDDARIVSEVLRKQWGGPERVEITVMPL